MTDPEAYLQSMFTEKVIRNAKFRLAPNGKAPILEVNCKKADKLEWGVVGEKLTYIEDTTMMLFRANYSLPCILI